MSSPDEPKIEPATIRDLEPLVDLLSELFEQEADFTPDRMKQTRAVRLILEEPNRGRIFVLRHHGRILGMVNLLVTISTAEGGFALLLEDFIIHRDFRGTGLGSKLLAFALAYAKEKEFTRITLLVDTDDLRAQEFYRHHGFHVSRMTPLRLMLNGGAER